MVLFQYLLGWHPLLGILLQQTTQNGFEFGLVFGGSFGLHLQAGQVMRYLGVVGHDLQTRWEARYMETPADHSSTRQLYYPSYSLFSLCSLVII